MAKFSVPIRFVSTGNMIVDAIDDDAAYEIVKDCIRKGDVAYVPRDDQFVYIFGPPVKVLTGESHRVALPEMDEDLQPLHG